MSQLPRLPVPDIRKTLDGYLRSVQPILLADEHSGGPPFAATYPRQRALVAAFLDGPARRAQARLIALDKISPHNWLDDNFWMKKTYLEWRAPLLINSNWWLTFVNDSNVPPEVVTNRAEGITSWQVRRAACLVHGILDFKHQMRSQDLRPDTSRIGLWLRHATPQIFNICRLPQHRCDTLTVPAPPSSPWASTVTLLAHDYYYALRVADPATGVPLPVDDIERGMRAVVNDVQLRRRNGELPVQVGILAADDRDKWSLNYSKLLSLSPQNKHSFEAVHQSLFVVSLDHWPAPSVPADRRDGNLPLTFDVGQRVPDSPPFQPPRSLPTMPSDLLSHQFAIRSSNSALNRFFDKPLSLIVEPSTRAGAMGEHSPVDALIPSVVCEWAVAGASGVSVCGGLANAPLNNDPQEERLDGLEIGSGSRWTRLDFISSPSIQAAIESAKQQAQVLISNSDHQVFYFGEWGGEEMERVSSHRPDGFVQLALQLAYFRIHRRPTAVYETALTRIFQHGRTETIRSFTTESYTFLRASAMWKAGSVGQTRSEPPPHLYSHLQSALKVHSSLARSAMMGRGVDRHLLGLRCILNDEWAWLDDASEDSFDLSQDTISQDTITKATSQTVSGLEMTVPLFEDAIFRKSQEWRLSTSGLSEGWWFRGTGFGSPYEDGYGINYLIGPHSVKFCVESKHSCPTTSTRAFIENVADALRDMREICLSAKKSNQECESTPANAPSNAEPADMPNAGATDSLADAVNNKIRHFGDSDLARPRL